VIQHIKQSRYIICTGATENARLENAAQIARLENARQINAFSAPPPLCTFGKTGLSRGYT